MKTTDVWEYIMGGPGRITEMTLGKGDESMKALKEFEFCYLYI
jgi:hypothetical protein